MASYTTTTCLNAPSVVNHHAKAVGSGEFGDLRNTYDEVFEVPTYTIKQIRDAIPRECFKRSTLRGLGYVARDIVLFALTLYLFNQFATPEYILSTNIRTLLWTIYGFINGLFLTGLWMLAHECGHQALSSSKVLNDIVGWLVHSALLVPYFSWKISHGKHHKSTGHMQRDMAFLPETRQQFSQRLSNMMDGFSEIAEDSPLHTLLWILVKQLVGWPMYLLTNVTGHNFHARQAEGRGYNKDGSIKQNGFLDGVNHFNPNSPIFDNRDAKYILLSDLGLAIAGTFLYWLGHTYGFKNLLVWYFLPYLWVNHWLIAITYLQHTDPRIPHYNAGAWTFTRGAAGIVDRDIGFIGRHLFHCAAQAHVLHHHVSVIPHYHSQKATEAIKKVMGKHYLLDRRTGFFGFYKTLYTNIRICQWVERSEKAEGIGKDILFHRNMRGVGPRPLLVE